MTNILVRKASTPDYYSPTPNAAKSEGFAPAYSFTVWSRWQEPFFEGISLVPQSQNVLPRNALSPSFYRQPPDLETFLAEQGVSPVTNLDDLAGDFWPEDESIDDFIAAVQKWRREDDASHS